MRHLIRSFFACALVLAGIVLTGSAASAHTMPESESVLICPSAEGDMDDPIEFRLGMDLDEVEALMGSDFELRQSKGSDFRTVYYEYGDITFSGTTSASDPCPPGKLRLTGIRCRNPWCRTPSGFHVGDEYEKVEAMYGRGMQIPRNRDSSTLEYEFPLSNIVFKMDDEGRIEEIGMYAMVGH